ncbi:alpha/beta hydrolase [Bailinhaonella thermotolerans]|uniref:alpha/beta hydrolase n=1 Tax=Bailinhaonella thermotolerans TaxID=1070861 RepID=UPI00192A3CFB|nr:alpha/beta hydrolase [Bailinhaonella thermotolerans]
MRRLVVALATAGVGMSGVLAAGPVSADPTPPVYRQPVEERAEGYQPQAPVWGKCASLPSPVECASVEVPLDYSRPHGRKIKIAISRHKATETGDKYQGILLANPGGPGASGLGYANPASMPARLGDVAKYYDVIGFDTRGVGASEPALSCDPTYQNPVRPPYVPADWKAERAWVKKAQGYARACQEKFGWLLPHMTTRDLARDMDSIRAALGRRQLSYVGYSYGTYLGAVYATMFPKNVRRLVLDSVVNPERVWYQANIDQNHAFEARSKDMWAWMAKGDAVYKLGATAAEVEKAYYAVHERVEKAPAGGLVGPAELEDTFLQGGYQSRFWPTLAAGLSEYYTTGKPDKLVTAYESYGDARDNDNSLAVYSAVECTDARWPRSWSVWHRDMWASHRKSPFLSWGNAWFNAQCAFWPVRGGDPVRIADRGLPPILIVQATKDAATPYRGAEVVHGILPNSRLVVENGAGDHGVTGRNTCATALFREYLGTGALPASKPGPDVLCDPRPEPPLPTPASGDQPRLAPETHDPMALGPRG